MRSRAVLNQIRLTIELVPETCWYSNVRSEVSTEVWDLIRRDVSKRANHRCEICGGRGPRHPVECHEVWHYDDEKHAQTLVRMIALCPACHEVKHIGFAETRGRGGQAREHLEKVNGWDSVRAHRYIKKAFEKWEERSRHEWTLDITTIDKYGKASR